MSEALSKGYVKVKDSTVAIANIRDALFECWQYREDDYPTEVSTARDLTFINLAQLLSSNMD